MYNLHSSYSNNIDKSHEIISVVFFKTNLILKCLLSMFVYEKRKNQHQPRVTQ